MSARGRTLNEIGNIAERIYRNKIRSLVMPQHKGEYIAIDIDSGDYEIDRDDFAAEDRLHARHPHATGFIMRIGYKDADSLGGRLIPEE